MKTMIVLVTAILLAVSVASTQAAPLPGLRDCDPGEYGVQAGPVGTPCSAPIQPYYCPHMRSGFIVLGIIDTGCMGGSGPDGS